MWSSLHFLKIAQRERCLRNQDEKMTLPSDDDDRSGRHQPTERPSGTNSLGENADPIGEADGRLPNISTIIKKYDSGKGQPDSEMIMVKEKEPCMDMAPKDYGSNQEITRGPKIRVQREKPQLLGNVDADNLENWKTIHPENWSPDEVMNWIYNIAGETEQIDVDLLCGEAFRGVTGKDLSKMTKQDFIKLDNIHGPLLYDLFSIINADFASPDDCHLSETIPFINELLLPGEDFSLGSSLNSPEPPDSPDSCCSTSTSQRIRLASLEIHGQYYPFDPDDVFKDWQDKPICVELLGDEKKSNGATIGTDESMHSVGSSATRTILLPHGSHSSTSSSDNDSVISGISATTYSGSSGSVFGQPVGPYETGTHEVPYAAQFERTLDEQRAFNYDYEYDQFMQQSIQLQPTPDQQTAHQIAAIMAIKERGYHQDPRTGLFYTFSESGSKTPKFPGVCDSNNSMDGVVPCQPPYLAPHQQHMGQLMQGPCPSQEQGKIVKRQKRTNGARATAPKTVRPKQPKKSPKKSNAKDPDRPKSKRGRKKGQLSKDNHLWRFLLDLLKDDRCNPEHIRWENRSQGIFTIVNSAIVAEMWGKKKKNDKMNYEKMSRAIRFCKTPGYIKDAPKDGTYPKKLCYAFGDNTTGWQENAEGN